MISRRGWWGREAGGKNKKTSKNFLIYYCYNNSNNNNNRLAFRPAYEYCLNIAYYIRPTVNKGTQLTKFVLGLKKKKTVEFFQEQLMIKEAVNKVRALSAVD